MQELADTIWLADLAFLVDTTKQLNALNVSLIGQDAVVSQLYDCLWNQAATSPKTPVIDRALHTYFSALCEVMDSFPQDKPGGMPQPSHLLQWCLTNTFGILQLSNRICCTSLPPSPSILMMLHISCSWSSLSSRHQQLSLVNLYRQLDKGRFPEMRTFAKTMLSLFDRHVQS